MFSCYSRLIRQNIFTGYTNFGQIRVDNFSGFDLFSHMTISGQSDLKFSQLKWGDTASILQCLFPVSCSILHFYEEYGEVRKPLEHNRTYRTHSYISSVLQIWTKSVSIVFRSEIKFELCKNFPQKLFLNQG